MHQFFWARNLASFLCLFTGLLFNQQRLTAQDTLQTILNRLHRHAASEEWKEAGWKDEHIEAWLDKLTDKCAQAAKFQALKLPIRFADVTPGDIKDQRLQQRTLLVGKTIDLQGSALSNCIVLADGNFAADSVTGCVVVARGVVELKTSDWSVIVAGTHVQIAERDGQFANYENGSLIATRGHANLQSAYGSLVFAGEGTTVRSARNAVFINAVLVGSNAERSRAVKIKSLPIEDLPTHPLASRLEIMGLIYPEVVERGELIVVPRDSQTAPQLLGVAVHIDDCRYLAEVGKPILDEANQPVASLMGWRLSYASEALAIFSSEDADAVVRIEK